MREKTDIIIKLSKNIDNKICYEYQYLAECGWEQSEITTELLKDIFLEIQNVDFDVQLEALKLTIDLWENTKDQVEKVYKKYNFETKNALNFIRYVNDVLIPILTITVNKISELVRKENERN